METCKLTINTPLESSIKYSKLMILQTLQKEHVMKDIPYANAIGNLQYIISSTWPNLVYSINHLTQFIANRGPQHWAKFKRMMHYFQHIKTIGIHYTNDSFTCNSNIIHGWNVVDWVNDLILNAPPWVIFLLFALDSFHGKIRSNQLLLYP